MPKINLLKKEVYELIAAGEVIERPASIVKELVENAADAGATAVTVEIKNGGRTFIRVTDNGCGIAYEDVPTAFLRHATSKVSEKDDLDNITTLGFRGEALASICAVAKVEILTRTKGSELGTHYVINAGEQKLYETAGCPDGTSIMIRDLFYNVPARLKFLKKDTTEANRIQELMAKLAVSHPDISMKLIRDNKSVIVTAGDGKLYSAVYSVFGREFANILLPVNYSREGARVSGYISKPLGSRNSRKGQVFYVNGRYVRSEVCSQALEEAYRNNIMVGKFPACVLCLDVVPEMIDVNVHPAKTEVRFSDNRYIYDTVYFAAKQALDEKDKPTRFSLDGQRFYSDEELYVKPEQPKPEQMVFAQPSQDEPNEPICRKEPQLDPMIGAYMAVKNGEEIVKKDNTRSDDLFLDSLDKPAWDGVLQPGQRVTEDISNSAGNAADDVIVDISSEEISHEVDTKEPDSREDILENFQYVSAKDFERKPKHETVQPESEFQPQEKPVMVGELFKTFIVAQCGESMILIDKHAAHERYIFENIKNDSRNLSSQMLLEPIMVTLSFDEYDALAANTEAAAKLGFVVEPDVAPTVAVHGLPTILKEQNPTDIITEIARKMRLYERDPAPEFYDDLYHTMACKAAIKAHDDTPREVLQKLVDSIYDEDIRYCPHGRPVKIVISKREIEKQFKRIV